MNQFIDKATPLLLALVLSVMGIAAALIVEAKDILAETDDAKRKKLASNVVLSALSPSLCLAAFSFDIWAITTSFATDEKALLFYNLKGKNNALLLMLAVHLFLYVMVLAWGGVVRGRASKNPRFLLELVLGVVAIFLCIAFQVYRV